MVTITVNHHERRDGQIKRTRSATQGTASVERWRAEIRRAGGWVKEVHTDADIRVFVGSYTPSARSGFTAVCTGEA
jgi:hypothetical protein